MHRKLVLTSNKTNNSFHFIGEMGFLTKYGAVSTGIFYSKASDHKCSLITSSQQLCWEVEGMNEMHSLRLTDDNLRIQLII